MITGCKELITFLSECISLLFRPATIIFTAKITFSLSPQVLGSEKTVDISRRYHWFPAKWRLRIDYRNSILMTCHCPDLDSDTSSVWNFWAPSSNFGRDPFNQNFRKVRSKTQWIGSVQPKKFRKNWSTFWGGPLFPVGPVGILVEWIAPFIRGETNGMTSFWGWLQSEPKPFLVSK